jgi:hypothetical protein
VLTARVVAGRADNVMPANISDISGLVSSGLLPIDVVQDAGKLSLLRRYRSLSRAHHPQWRADAPRPNLLRVCKRLQLGREPTDTENSGCSDTAIIGSSSKAGTAIAIGVAPPGSSSSLAFGSWAMDHFVKPFAPAFKKIVIITIHLGGLSEKDMGIISNYVAHCCLYSEIIVRIVFYKLLISFVLLEERK